MLQVLIKAGLLLKQRKYQRFIPKIYLEKTYHPINKLKTLTT